MSAESWRAEQDAHLARAAAVADAVAAHVDGWESEHDTPAEGEHRANPKLVHPATGARVYVSPVTYGAGGGVRVELSAAVPSNAVHSQGDYQGIDRPEISVKSDRDAAALAKDVERRLLPAAIEYHAEVSGRIERRTAAANRRETLARELADIMGGTASAGRDDRWKASLPDRLRGQRPETAYTYGDMTPDSDGEVTAEIRNMTAQEARQLAALIAGWRK